MVALWRPQPKSPGSPCHQARTCVTPAPESYSHELGLRGSLLRHLCSRLQSKDNTCLISWERTGWPAGVATQWMPVVLRAKLWPLLHHWDTKESLGCHSWPRARNS